MNDNELGKSVFGEDWLLEEKSSEKDEFVKSYMEIGRLTGEKLGFFLGQDNKYYYIVWYMMLEEKIVLIKCLIKEFEAKFPSDQIEREMKKLLPEYPPQPIGLKNKHLERIKKERNIVRL